MDVAAIFKNAFSVRRAGTPLTADEPLVELERDAVADTLQISNPPYAPNLRYLEETELEELRIETWVREEATQLTRNYLQEPGIGDRRIAIIARHNVKRRWQKLGIWNPDWKVSDRPYYEGTAWKWPWHRNQASVRWRRGPKATALNPRHPVTRALRQREGLRRGQHLSQEPQSRLQNDATSAEGESFIMSRPWFQFMIETQEEAERVVRVDWKRQPKKSEAEKYVRSVWQEHDAWKEGWGDGENNTILPGWKWRDESPSPEPEDLARLENLDDFELTPSEVDALEGLRPSIPELPFAWPDSPRRGDVRTFDPVVSDRHSQSRTPTPPPPYSPPAYSLNPPNQPPAQTAVPEPMDLDPPLPTAPPSPSSAPMSPSPPPAPQPRPRRQPRKRKQPKTKPVAETPRRSARLAAKAKEAVEQPVPQPSKRQRQPQPRRQMIRPSPPPQKASAPTKSRGGRPKKNMSEAAGVKKSRARAQKVETVVAEGGKRRSGRRAGK